MNSIFNFENQHYFYCAQLNFIYCTCRFGVVSRYLSCVNWYFFNFLLTQNGCCKKNSSFFSSKTFSSKILPSKLIEWFERLLIHKLQIRISLITKVQQDIFLLELSENGKICRKVFCGVFFMSETSKINNSTFCVSKSQFRG